MAKKVAIRINKFFGESVIRLLKKHKLFDESFKIKHEENFIFIPIRKEPSKKFLKVLKKISAKARIEKIELEKRTDKPKGLTDSLRGRLAPNVLERLPKSVDIIGDIAVIEIPPEIESYKGEIGKSLLDINKNINTVLMKAGPITNEYRVRDYEPVAGRGKTSTEHKEFGCRYSLDITKAYFSPRLSFEHARISSGVKEGEIIVDMFAGVGPFSILIAKRIENVKVYAIDLNPEAVKFLVKNIAINKVKKKVTAVYGDTREVATKHIQKVADRVIMNLPSESIKFIDVACKVLKREGGVLHIYYFIDESSSIDEKIEELKKKMSTMNRKVTEIKFSRKVREIAPRKWQIVIDAEII